MTETTPRASARIYQFPIRDRTAKVGHRDSQKAIANLASTRLQNADFGSGWYHEAAIGEAEQARTR
jgi:hypothetical protein